MRRCGSGKTDYRNLWRVGMHIPHPANCESNAFFLIAFWQRRGHNHRRIDVSRKEQVARVPRGSELCRSYHSLSRCTPSTICPLSKPTPINDQLGLVSLVNHYVPTAMEVDAGTVVLALVLDTLSGRSPLYRLEEFFAQHDTELLLGKAVSPQALNDDTVGRVLIGEGAGAEAGRWFHQDASAQGGRASNDAARPISHITAPVLLCAGPGSQGRGHS